MKIFISYRRDDSAGYAGRLFEHLTAHFGTRNVFMDIDTIEPGEDFRKVVRDAVVTCDVVLVLMGKHWLGIKDGQGLRRLDDPNDWVRAEIATALTNANVRVIPVLVRGASMPAEHELPPDLKELSWRNALELSDSRFQHDAGKLISVIERTGDRPKAVAKGSRSASTLTRFMPISLGVIGIGLIIALVWIGWKFLGTTPIFTSAPSMSPTGSSAMTLPTQALLPTQPNASPDSAFQRGDTIQHTVVEGESLFQIARCYGADFEQVLGANPQIDSLRTLSTGFAIIVPNIGSAGEIYEPPCGAYYTIQSGDSWDSIARKFNADVAVLQAANIGNPLAVDQVLVIPSSAVKPFVISTPTFLITPSLTYTLFKTDVDILPNQPPVCAEWGIRPGQVLYFKTTTSTDQINHVVRGPNEIVGKNTGILNINGSLNPKSSMYEYCIYNRSSDTVTYTLEVSISY